MTVASLAVVGSVALGHHATTTWVLWIVAAAIVLSVLAGFLGRALLRRGLREPFVVRLINRASERVVVVIKRPITIAVLDEVAAVLSTGHYTRNVANALQDNRDEIKAMIADKVKHDPAGKRIGLVPFSARLVDEITETALRVILEVLADPRMEELVDDILRDTTDQIRRAVRDSDPTSPGLPA
jgi:hypothetical protein